MAWRAVTLTLAAQHADCLSDALLAAGAIAVDTADAHEGTAQERALFAEPGAASEPAWSETRLRALFAAGDDIAASLRVALADCGLNVNLPYETASVADQDWVRLTQSQFAPVHIGERLWVVPTWHAPPEPDAINLVIDPGLAFGTGTHPTTRLCLQWLMQTMRGGETLIDYGCGSGILGIAAMKLGAGSAVCVDVDPQAVVAARGNALQNRVALRCTDAGETDSAALAAADIVVANILSNPLRVLAPLLAGLTKPGGGRLALSGVLVSQAAEVAAAYAPWLSLTVSAEAEGWVLLSGTRALAEVVA